MSENSFGKTKQSPFGILITVLIAIFVLFAVFASFYSDWQWFRVTFVAQQARSKGHFKESDRA